MEILGQFFLAYGYIIAFPVMVVEGPLSTMLMAALASGGYFNVLVVFLLSFFADIISDYIFYEIGRRGARGAIIRLSKIFRYDPNRIQSVQGFFYRYGGLAVFLAKLLPGMVPPVFIAAGMSRYSRVRLLLYAMPAGIVWSAALCAIGYYFGHSITSVERLLSKTGIVICVIAVALILYLLFFGKALSKRAMDNEKQAL